MPKPSASGHALPLAMAIFALFACRAEAPKPKPTSVVPVASSAPLPSAAASAASRPVIAKERVVEFVERWRSAQERSDFDAYRSLYAPSFRGVKRAGDKVSRFDRAGWMKDRQELFARDVTLTVSELRVFPSEKAASVTFLQTWSTPRYRDVGPKRLELLLESDRLLITSEEMLASTNVKPDSSKLPRPEELALVWSLRKGDGYLVVLRSGPSPTRGPARKVPVSTNRDDFLVEKDVTEAALGPFASFKARSLDLYGPEGLACTATVSSFRAVGGFSTWSETESADEVWSAVGDSQYLVAVVVPKGCTSRPIWARASDRPKPSLFERRDLDATETALARRALAKTKEARAIQESYAALRTEKMKPTWQDLEPRAWAARTFTHPETKASYVAAELSTGEGCSEFGGYAFGFFKAASPEWLDLTGDGRPGDSMPLRPILGLVPEVGVQLVPGGPVYFVGDEILFGDSGAGFAPLVTMGRVRTTCSC